MSKTLEALNSPESKNEGRGDRPVAPTKEAVFSPFTAVLWVTASILATVFSYQLGIQQGREETVEANSPKEWVYYFNEEEAIPALAPSQKVSVVSSGFQVKQAAQAIPKPVQEVGVGLKPAPTSISPRGGFAIQLVTYKSLKMAGQEAVRLKQKGEDAFVIQSGKYYLVCMHLSKDRKAVEQKLTQLTKQGYSKIYPGAYVRGFKE